jgi:short-subunit dehydrogenase
LRGFNIALHMEMKPRGITVSGVLPGAIDTPMLLKETREGATALNFLGDPLPPEKVAKVILRAAKEGKVEYYIPYIASVSCRASHCSFRRSSRPSIHGSKKWASSARRSLSRKPRQRCAAVRHTDPGARTGGGLLETGR